MEDGVFFLVISKIKSYFKFCFLVRIMLLMIFNNEVAFAFSSRNLVSEI